MEPGGMVCSGSWKLGWGPRGHVISARDPQLVNALLRGDKTSHLIVKRVSMCTEHSSGNLCTSQVSIEIDVDLLPSNLY